MFTCIVSQIMNRILSRQNTHVALKVRETTQPQLLLTCYYSRWLATIHSQYDLLAITNTWKNTECMSYLTFRVLSYFPSTTSSHPWKYQPTWSLHVKDALSLLSSSNMIFDDLMFFHNLGHQWWMAQDTGHPRYVHCVIVLNWLVWIQLAAWRNWQLRTVQTSPLKAYLSCNKYAHCLFEKLISICEQLTNLRRMHLYKLPLLGAETAHIIESMPYLTDLHLEGVQGLCFF